MPETFIDYEDGCPRTPAPDLTRTETRRYVVHDAARGEEFIYPPFLSEAEPFDLEHPSKTIIITAPPRQSDVPWEWAHENICKVADLDFDHPARQYVARIITDTIAEYRS